MEYVYATMMLHSAGQELTEENITKVLEAGGTEVDEARVKALQPPWKMWISTKQ